MLFGILSEAYVKMEKHRLDCAGCSGSRSGRPESHRQSKTKRQVCAHSPFTHFFVEKYLKNWDAFGLLWGSFRCSGDPLGSPKAAKVAKKVDRQTEGLEAALAPSGTRMLPKGPRDLKNGAHVVPK